MTTEILNGQPPQPADEALLKAYHDTVIKQADLYVDLAKEPLKLELAIPGIYAAALKLVTDQSPYVPLVTRGGEGSHRVYGRDGEPTILNFQNRDGPIAEYQARQLIKMMDQYEVNA